MIPSAAVPPGLRAHTDCHVCRSEGFVPHRVRLQAGAHEIIATPYQVTGDVVGIDEAALSESAWARLGLEDGATITVAHPHPVESLAHVTSRIYGNALSGHALYPPTNYRNSPAAATLAAALP